MRIFFSNPSNWLSNTVKVVAAYSGADYELVKINQADIEDYKTNKNPSGLFPYMEIENQGVAETQAIIRYIARLYPDSGLYGRTVFESAKIDSILDYTVGATFKGGQAFYTAMGFRQSTQKEFKASMDSFKESLRHLDSLLQDKEYFVGDSVTLADLRVASGLVYFMRILMDPGFAKVIPNLIKHFERVTSDERFRNVFGACRVGKRPIKVNLKKEEKKKKEEVKQAPKKKAEKPKDPLEAIKSTMDLNEFKFWFINHPEREQAFDEFVAERLDRNAWSFWDLRYIKYKGEGEHLYKTNNLLNGFIQRAEHFGKHSYGVHMIYGEEPNLDIKGVWMWKGHEIPEAMNDHPQFEYYNTKKLDIDNETDRAYIKEMWCAKDGPLKDGTPIQNWKYQK